MSFFKYLGKDKNSKIIRYNAEAINFSKDPLLSFLLQELKNVALRIENSFQHTAMGSGLHKPYFIQYNNFCSQIEDALELFEYDNSLKPTLQSVNFNNVAKDFSEGFANRYGSELSMYISLIVSSQLNLVETNSGMILKFLDCIVRSSLIHAPESHLAIEIKQSKIKHSAVTNNTLQHISICFNNIGFAVDTDRIAELIQEFYAGNLNNALRVLGVEFCTALLTAHKNNATIQISNNSQAETQIEFSFPFKLADGKVFAVTQCPKDFYLYSKSTEMIDIIRRIAKSEKKKVTLVKANKACREDEFLVFDATEYNEKTIELLKSITNKNNTVIILSSYDSEKMKSLSLLGFHYFLSIPLVSSQLFYCLHQYEFAKFQPQHSFSKLPQRRKLRVLVVDDSMTARIFLKDYFEAEGHEVVEATDGLEFVKLIEDGEKYDIVFCDQTMSHMNGSVAAKKVRDFEANSNVKPTPIILITAYDSLESESDANCFDRIFRKPVDISKVEKALNAFVYSDAPVSRKKSIATDTQIIDLEDLRSRCAGKEKTMLRVLDAFKETSVAQLNKLEDTAVLSNIEQLKKTIHTIKGLLRDAGANNGAEIVSEIEEKIATNKAIEEADVKAIRELIQKTCASADNIKSRI